jgi:hypothetical protein
MTFGICIGRVGQWGSQVPGQTVESGRFARSDEKSTRKIHKKNPQEKSTRKIHKNNPQKIRVATGYKRSNQGVMRLHPDLS